MAEFSDKELRELLDAASTPEGEGLLAALLDDQPHLRDRLSALSGEDDFTTHFDPAGDRYESSPEVEELISAIQSDPWISAGLGSKGTRTPPESVFLDYLAPSTVEGSLGALGSYEVQSIIANGGMGVVYRALDPDLDRIVAIKMLSPAYLGSKEAKKRFHREARAAAAIEHPNVISIYAVDRSTAELPFLVMQIVEGGSLAQRMRGEEGERLPMTEVLRVSRGIAAGLAAAHAQGLIHRDIKPSNVLLEQGGEGIWLTDFGLARATEDPGITGTRTFVGTPEFASPEQCEGREIDHRSDLFSFGAVLYSLVAGRRPFQGETITSLMYQIVHEPHVPIREANPSCPGWLADLIDQLLEKDPERRPQSADAALAALDGATSAPKVHRSNRSKAKLVAAVLGCVLAAGLISWMGTRPGHENEVIAEPGPVSVPAAQPPSVIVLEGPVAGPYSRLADAVAAAKPGDIIELATSETLVIPATIEIRRKKFLTIRAAKGHRPVLAVDSLKTIIDTYSPLILEGLTFEQPAGMDEPGTMMVRSEASPLFIANCRFLRPPVVGRFTRPGFARGEVKVGNLRVCRITNCEVYAPDGGGLRFGAQLLPGQVRVENSALLTKVALILGNFSNGATKLSVRNCVSRTLCFLELRSSRSPVAVSAEDSVIRSTYFSHGGTMFAPAVNVDDLAGSLRWTGRGNLYEHKNFVSPVTKNPSGLDLRGEFTWGEDEPGSVVELTDQMFGEHLRYRTVEDLRAIAPADLAPKGDSASSHTSLGLKPDIVGPGPGYDRWRATEEYRTWSEEARQKCLGR